MSKITESEIEKLAFDYAQLQGTNYPLEEIYQSMIWKQIKGSFIKGYKTAIQNKVSDISAVEDFKKSAGGWIDIKDRLPKAGEAIEVWLSPNDKTKSHKMDWHWEEYDTENLHIAGCKVTHWRHQITPESQPKEVKP